jgi:signal transduction histidine kinase
MATTGSAATSDAGILRFTVDSALLRELGERLVGRPSIALAELIKNSYDADATQVSVELSDDRIAVGDNGVGMDLAVFRDFWMRIGTPHKQLDATSARFGRRLTGSKGVGRLSTQFLATKLRVQTVSMDSPQVQLEAEVDWPAAVQAGELTEAGARYRQGPTNVQLPDSAGHGTRIELNGLNHKWTARELEELAREIWWLQAPFRATAQNTPAATFKVQLSTGDPDAFERFGRQMNAYLNLWDARLVGRLESLNDPKPLVMRRWVNLSLEFAGGQTKSTTWRYPIERCQLAEVEFEIRVFNLRNRQPYGLRVDEVREYLKRFGGVHVYDGGFHLPYYGADTDWLNVEQDHSHRLSRSQLLPEELQVPGGMTYLPTNSRLLGIVQVDTSQERQVWEQTTTDVGREYLMIQISRDRLVDNSALRNLREIVRTALDYYAVQEARRSAREHAETAPVEPFSSPVEAAEDIIDKHEEIEPNVRTSLKTEIKAVLMTAESNAQELSRQAGLLGALATAGITAVAYEHEIAKQYSIVEGIGHTIEGWASKRPSATEIEQTAKELFEWIEGARELRSIFASVVDEVERSRRYRYLAKSLVDQVFDRMKPLIRDVTVDTRLLNPSLRLPPGRFSEWSALFQNLFTNAANAMVDAPLKLLAVSAVVSRGETQILVQDTGTGVDVASSDDLFKPFVRKQAVSPERRRLGLGGTGLGLSIVRMLSGELHCSVKFVDPTSPYRTSVAVSWRERERA